MAELDGVEDAFRVREHGALPFHGRGDDNARPAPTEAPSRRVARARDAARRTSPRSWEIDRVADGDAVERDDVTAVNRATYDRISSRYAANQLRQRPADGRWFPALEDAAFLGSMPAGGLIADLGCGPGRDGARSAEAGFRVVAMDLSTGMADDRRRVSRWTGRPGRPPSAADRSGSAGRHLVLSCARSHIPEDGTAQALAGVQTSAEALREPRPGHRFGRWSTLGRGSFSRP